MTNVVREDRGKCFTNKIMEEQISRVCENDSIIFRIHSKLIQIYNLNWFLLVLTFEITGKWPRRGIFNQVHSLLGFLLQMFLIRENLLQKYFAWQSKRSISHISEVTNKILWDKWSWSLVGSTQATVNTH